jgi:RNA recognition motif-containing protein
VDAAVFPARIGPLGYAFVKFEKIEDAINAFNTLNNAVVPALSGTKQVKMRYKPVSEGMPVRDAALDALQGTSLA